MKNKDNGYDSYINDDTRDERAEFDNLFNLIGVSYGGYDLYQVAQTLPYGYLDDEFSCAPSSWGDYATGNLIDLFASQAGSYVANKYFVSTDSKEEYIGAKIGSTAGGAFAGFISGG